MTIYLDGHWVSEGEAKISVFDHGLLYGDGVFEGIRAYEGHLFRLDQHLDRLYKSADFIELSIPLSRTELEQIVYASLDKNGLKNAYIRLLVTRGKGDLGLDPRVCSHPSVIVITGQIALFPKTSYVNGLEAAFVKTRRNIPQAIESSIKSMNYLNSILAKIEANHLRVPEGILLNRDGYVAECSGDNVFYVKGSSIVTPSLSAGVLPGITRAAVIEIIIAQSKFTVEEKLFPPQDLLDADEVFFTGTAAEVIPVTKIDSKSIGTGRPGPITEELMMLFKDLTRSEATRLKG